MISLLVTPFQTAGRSSVLSKLRFCRRRRRRVGGGQVISRYRSFGSSLSFRRNLPKKKTSYFIYVVVRRLSYRTRRRDVSLPTSVYSRLPKQTVIRRRVSVSASNTAAIDIASYRVLSAPVCPSDRLVRRCGR